MPRNSILPPGEFENERVALAAIVEDHCSIGENDGSRQIGQAALGATTDHVRLDIMASGDGPKCDAGDVRFHIGKGNVVQSDFIAGGTRIT